MFSIQKSDVTTHQPSFCGTKPLGSLTLLSEKERKQDTNFNILEVDYDRNENWRQEKKTTLDEKETKLKEVEEMPSLEDNRNHLKKKAMGQLKVTMSEGISLSSSDEEEEVRSPPEGAEILHLGGEKPAHDATRQCVGCPTSPLEDNGYASSSLSIESPDSVSGNMWEETDIPVQAAIPQDEADTEESDVESSSDSESLSSTLVEAYQNLQDREMLKEREKEKHHAQLTMYRRLALLRWIRCLQQKVRDQQNRLQESFDTILDNRKELLRYIQHGCNKIPTKEAV